MDEKIIVETTEKSILNELYKKSSFSLFILLTSLLLALINVVLKSSYHIGAWSIISFTISLIPLLWLIFKKEIRNRYTRWFLPIVFILLADIFYYNNDFTQEYLPFILFVLIVLIYLTSMQSVTSLYQTLIPKKAIPLELFSYLKIFISSLLAYRKHNSIYTRVGIALLITIPVIALFLFLFMSADANFEYFIKNIFNFDNPFKGEHIFLIPLYFVTFLWFFIYSLSNAGERELLHSDKVFDPLIIGIFLGLLNALFVTFLLFQVNYLFGGEAYIKASSINVADFAREGFFQLMWVMGIVLSIFLLIMSRFRGEKSIALLLSGLVLSTIVIGIASLKKMHLYQSIKGATVLRYYVEWFDYFLLLVLGIGILFILKRIHFSKLLDTVIALGVVALVIVSSMNIDAMVASHNIEKFKATPEKLDIKSLSRLSVDALPQIQGTDIILTFYPNQKKRNCGKLSEYHFGYCQIVDKYGYKQIKYLTTWVQVR